MEIHSIIKITYAIFVTMSLLLSKYEKNTLQRNLGFIHSSMNFLALYALSFGLTSIPTGEGSQNIIFTVLGWLVMSDAIFTLTHRTLHTPTFYWIHKQHHLNNSKTGTYSTSTFDSHILEFLFGNVATALIPPLILRGTDTMQMVWFVTATINTILSHTNVSQWGFGEGPHLIHHRRMKCNYGQGLYLWDRLLGTYSVS